MIKRTVYMVLEVMEQRSYKRVVCDFFSFPVLMNNAAIKLERRLR